MSTLFAALPAHVRVSVYADVELRLAHGAATFACHRLVLARHSYALALALTNGAHTCTDGTTLTLLSGRHCALLSVRFPTPAHEAHVDTLLAVLYADPAAPLTLPLPSDLHDAFALLDVALALGVPRLEAALLQHLMQSVSTETSVAMLHLMRERSGHRALEALEARCLATVARHFTELAPHLEHGLAWLPPAAFARLLRDPRLDVDDEYALYEHVRKYVEMALLCETVRLAHMRHCGQLYQVWHDGLVSEAALVQALLFRLDVREGRALDPSTPAWLLPREPRGRLVEHDPSAPGHGVLWLLGARGGEWKNPVLTGEVKVTVSSVQKGKVPVLVEPEPHEFWTNDVPSSWIAIDLRRDRRLRLHGYSLRHGASFARDFLRSWVIQGSHDGREGWVTLMRVTGDDSLAHSGAFAVHVWHLTPPREAYRHFRVLQTGHNSGKNNFLVLSGIELFGELFTDAEAPTSAAPLS